jgi:CRP/FNR family transcriptional regulator
MYRSDQITSAVSSTQHHSPVEAGRQRPGKLWSNLKEVCDLLHIATAVSVNNEEGLFQHVQFKGGQCVHAIGQGYDV